MNSTTLIFAVAIAASAVFAQDALIIQSPPSLIQCQPTLVSWSGGTGPFYVAVLPGGQASATALESFPEQTGDSYTWTVDLAAGQEVTFRVTDSTGAINYSSQVTIYAGSSTTCVGGGSTSAASLSGSSSISISSSSSRPASSATSSGMVTSTRSASSSKSTSIGSSSSSSSSSSSTSSTGSSSTSSSASSSGSTAPAGAAAAATSTSKTGGAADKYAANLVGLLGLAALVTLFA